MTTKSRLLAVLISVAFMFAAGAGMATADPGENNPRPEQPPCDADHGHPGANAPQCQGDGDADGTDADGTDADGTDADGTDADGTDADGTDADGTTAGNCTAGAGDPGLLTDDTLGQTVYDGGLNVSPLFEDPEANGPISGAVYDGGNGTPLEPVTDEVACAVDLLIDESTGGDL